MNGRLYDPTLHRFLMPDNYVQDPYNTQNFNRYGYVLNNPLMYTDPNGEFFAPLLIGAAISVATNGLNNIKQGRGFFRGAGKAAMMGIFGSITSYNIGNAHGVVNTIASMASQSFEHAMLGGVMNYAQGENFWHGAIAGGVGSFSAQVSGTLLSRFNFTDEQISAISTLVAGISGGVSSNATGGEFWSGFRNASITALFNHAFHKFDKEILKKAILNDGRLTLDEANEWYRRGGGEELIVEAKYIDLNFINPDNWTMGDLRSVNTFFRSKDGAVYGSIDVQFMRDNQFYIYKDKYEFEMHSFKRPLSLIRNFNTKFASIIAGKGRPYNIFFNGYNTVNHNSIRLNQPYYPYY